MKKLVTLIIFFCNYAFAMDQRAENAPNERIKELEKLAAQQQCIIHKQAEQIKFLENWSRQANDALENNNNLLHMNYAVIQQLMVSIKLQEYSKKS